jgi:hypothetical protein
MLKQFEGSRRSMEGDVVTSSSSFSAMSVPLEKMNQQGDEIALG